jgi:hypothetical protein
MDAVGAMASDGAGAGDSSVVSSPKKSSDISFMHGGA